MGDLTGLLDRPIRKFQSGAKGCPHLLIGPASLPVHDDLGVLEHLAHGLPDPCPSSLLVDGHQHPPRREASPLLVIHQDRRQGDEVGVLVRLSRSIFCVIYRKGEHAPRDIMGAVLLILASRTHAGWLHLEHVLHGFQQLYVIGLSIHSAVFDRMANLDRRRNDEFRESPGHGASLWKQLGAIPVEPQHEVPKQSEGQHTGIQFFLSQTYPEPELRVQEPDPNPGADHEVAIQVARETSRLPQALQVLPNIRRRIAARLGLIGPVVPAKEDDWVHGLFYLAWTAGTVTTRSGSSERTSCTRRLP